MSLESSHCCGQSLLAATALVNLVHELGLNQARIVLVLDMVSRIALHISLSLRYARLDEGILEREILSLTTDYANEDLWNHQSPIAEH